ncbi:MAG: glycosyltransferase family 4 protein [Flavobacteriales bacterium]|nr:glycosyltransferase family 4 protein [Flavobacteriales bacterium]
MIRVVLCTDGVFPHAVGGMQRHSRLLAEHLAATGRVELTVIHPHAAPLFDPALKIHEIVVAPIDTTKLYLAELWRYSDRVAEVLKGLDAAVIISQGFCVWKDIDLFRERLVVHPHGLEMLQAMGVREKLVNVPFRYLLRYVTRRSRYVVSLGGRLTRMLEDVTRGSGSTVVTIPNAVEVPNAMVPYAPKDSPMRLLFVGRFAFNKGLDVLMSVARRLEKEGNTDVVFDLAGGGPLLATYQSMGLPGNVNLLGRVDDERLFRSYEECDAFLLPTRFEGMPTVVLEAMARSRPIFVSDVGATAELVDKHNGYLLPKGDADALYKAVVEFSRSPVERRRSMARASWERAADRFQWRKVTTEFVRLAERVNEGRAPSVNSNT